MTVTVGPPLACPSVVLHDGDTLSWDIAPGLVAITEDHLARLEKNPVPLTTRDMPGANPIPCEGCPHPRWCEGENLCDGKKWIEQQRIGDQMQSALSRILAMLETATESPAPPLDYETQLAVIEGHSCIEQWTEARSRP